MREPSQKAKSLQPLEGDRRLFANYGSYWYETFLVKPIEKTKLP